MVDLNVNNVYILSKDSFEKFMWEDYKEQVCSKTTVWVFQARNRRNCTQDHEMAKKERLDEINWISSYNSIK